MAPRAAPAAPRREPKPTLRARLEGAYNLYWNSDMLLNIAWLLIPLSALIRLSVRHDMLGIVHDLSFELHRMYGVMRMRPWIIGLFLFLMLAAEWVLEKYEEADLDAARRAALVGDEPGWLGRTSRAMRALGRTLLPAMLGMLIGCAILLVLTSAILGGVAAPTGASVLGLVSSASSCSKLGDCILVTGTAHQRRLHGVYMLTHRSCSSKPVYKQLTGDGLFLHSPSHENQWNVGPDVCDNSPRNKWMELYSTAGIAADIRAATWFEYTDEQGTLLESKSDGRRV